MGSDFLHHQVHGFISFCNVAMFDAALAFCRVSGAALEQLGQQLLELCQEGVSDRPVSYNVIFTPDFLMYVPRKTEMAGPCAIK